MVSVNDATAWYRRLNVGVSACLLLNCVPFVACIWGKEYDKTSMLFIRNTTIVEAAKVRFNIGAAFLMATIMCSIAHAWIAAFPSAPMRAILKGTNPYRWGMLMFSMPTLHVAMLFGLAIVNSIWAFFASTMITMLMLSALSLMEKSDDRHVCTSLLFGVFYITFWGFAWWTGTRENPIALSCMCAFIVGFLGILLIARPTTKAGCLYKETAMIIATTVLHLAGMWLWVAAQAKVFKLAPWSAFCVIVLVTASFATYNVEKIHGLTFDTAQAGGEEKLLGGGPDEEEAPPLNDTEEASTIIVEAD